MGHVTSLQFNFPQADRGIIEAMLRSAPFFSSSENADFYFRGQDNLQENSLDPDFEISLIHNGLRLNALGDYRVCNQVTEYLQERIRQSYGNPIHLL